jgi:hypothetical protein
MVELCHVPLLKNLSLGEELVLDGESHHSEHRLATLRPALEYRTFLPILRLF